MNTRLLVDSMKKSKWGLRAAAAVVLGVAFVACGQAREGGTNTNWIACTEDSDCPSTDECIARRCTRRPPHEAGAGGARPQGGAGGASGGSGSSSGGDSAGDAGPDSSVSSGGRGHEEPDSGAGGALACGEFEFFASRLEGGAIGQPVAVDIDGDDDLDLVSYTMNSLVMISSVSHSPPASSFSRTTARDTSP